MCGGEGEGITSPGVLHQPAGREIRVPPPTTPPPTLCDSTRALGAGEGGPSSINVCGGTPSHPFHQYVGALQESLHALWMHSSAELGLRVLGDGTPLSPPVLSLPQFLPHPLLVAMCVMTR